MTKCPSCNSDMIWKGSILDGGLGCPLECETAFQPKKWKESPYLSVEYRDSLLNKDWEDDPYDGCPF